MKEIEIDKKQQEISARKPKLKTLKKRKETLEEVVEEKRKRVVQGLEEARLHMIDIDYSSIFELCLDLDQNRLSRDALNLIECFKICINYDKLALKQLCNALKLQTLRNTRVKGINPLTLSKDEIKFFDETFGAETFSEEQFESNELMRKIYCLISSI